MSYSQLDGQTEATLKGVREKLTNSWSQKTQDAVIAVLTEIPHEHMKSVFESDPEPAPWKNMIRTRQVNTRELYLAIFLAWFAGKFEGVPPASQFAASIKYFLAKCVALLPIRLAKPVLEISLSPMQARPYDKSYRQGMYLFKMFYMDAKHLKAMGDSRLLAYSLSPGLYMIPYPDYLHRRTLTYFDIFSRSLGADIIPIFVGRICKKSEFPYKKPNDNFTASGLVDTTGSTKREPKRSAIDALANMLSEGTSRESIVNKLKEISASYVYEYKLAMPSSEEHTTNSSNSSMAELVRKALDVYIMTQAYLKNFSKDTFTREVASGKVFTDGLLDVHDLKIRHMLAAPNAAIVEKFVPTVLESEKVFGPQMPSSASSSAASSKGGYMDPSLLQTNGRYERQSEYTPPDLGEQRRRAAEARERAFDEKLRREKEESLQKYLREQELRRRDEERKKQNPGFIQKIRNSLSFNEVEETYEHPSSYSRRVIDYEDDD